MNGKRIKGKHRAVVFCAGLLLIAASACSKHPSEPEIVVEIPAGFNGNFSLEMGVKDAPPLIQQGNSYTLTVPKNGKLATSTLLPNAHAVFRNASDGTVWGYSYSSFTTGDGIPVGGKIEFFVGTKKDYDAEENKKNHSRGSALFRESPATA
jgi:hypothetical protein